MLGGQIPWLREKWASLSEFVMAFTIPQASGIGQRHAAQRQGGVDYQETIQAEERPDFAIAGLDRLRCRTRYFTDSRVIGTK